VTAEALKQVAEVPATPPLRSNWHLVGMAAGLLVPMSLLWSALRWRLPSEAVLGFLVISATLGFAGCRSARRWFYPDRLPVRWAADSVLYERLKVLDWAAYGVNVVVMLILLMFMLGEVHRSSETRCLWVVFMIISSGRMILMQYREDRKPLPPQIPPRDPSQLWTDTIKPVYSKDWGLPGER
jgi:hypothetical protein